MFKKNYEFHEFMPNGMLNCKICGICVRIKYPPWDLATIFNSQFSIGSNIPVVANPTPVVLARVITKTIKKPFIQAKTLSLMPQLYAFPCKQARSKSMHPQHQSLRDKA